MRERGLTLIELMVTLAIVSILAGIAVVAVRGDPVGGGSRAIMAMLQEAHRLAVAGGPVRADVVTATGIRARARVEFATTEDGVDVVTAYVLAEAEGEADATWEVVSYGIVPQGARIWAVADTAVTDPAAEDPEEMVLTAPGDEDAVTRDFYPDGTSDPLTVYVHRANEGEAHVGSHERVVVYPLSAIPSIQDKW